MRPQLRRYHRGAAHLGSGGMHRERVGRVGRRGERHGEEDGRKGGGLGLEVARETWGIAEVFSVFTYKGLNVGRGTLGWTGLPAVG